MVMLLPLQMSWCLLHHHGSKSLVTMDMSADPLQVMDLVELRSLQHALVGQPSKGGLSVEACKRLTIAVEMVSEA